MSDKYYKASYFKNILNNYKVFLIITAYNLYFNY